MSEVRRHQRQTASGKTTTVRHHTRSGDKTQRRDGEVARERETRAERAAPHVSSIAAEPEAQREEWWAEDEMPPPGAFWADDDEVGNFHGVDGDGTGDEVEYKGRMIKVNRAPAYQPQGDHDFAPAASEPEPAAPKRAEPQPHPQFTGEVRKPPRRRLTRKQKKAAVRKYQAARRALDRYHCDHETPKYLKLNKAVIEAEKDVPWWRRF